MWLIYALGGGWGHLTRAVALASIARRERQVRVLTNSAYAPIVAASLPTLDLVMLDACAPAEAVRRAVQREIAACRPSCLIVDTFPRGIGGELAGVLGPLAAHKVLVHRDLNPRYVDAAGIRGFVASHYEMVIVPGPGEGSQLGDLPIALETDPWLVRSADEIPDPGAVRERLRLGPREECCVLVCASGKKEELDWYGAVVSAIHWLDPAAPVRLVAAERPEACAKGDWVRYWPAMDLFGRAAVVVGGAGYNTIRECLAWGVPLMTRPWPRTYDRQEARAKNASPGGRLTIVQTPQDAAQSALAQMAGGPPGAPRFTNGAAEAVRRIAELVEVR